MITDVDDTVSATDRAEAFHELLSTLARALDIREMLNKPKRVIEKIA